ncbi:hypothetical protein [Sulfurimonas sp.]|uniref:hypothetical protein n=1 Tax=Sulfurimonas sp. TaxID=2022749 RepID=UPI003564FA61
MRYILTILLLAGFAHADIIKKKTLACPTIEQLEKAPVDKADNLTDLSMYAIANDCVMIDRRDNIEAVGYDPTNSKEIYQKIFYKKTAVYLYVLRSSIQVEQDGKKSSYRF